MGPARRDHVEPSRQRSLLAMTGRPPAAMGRRRGRHVSLCSRRSRRPLHEHDVRALTANDEGWRVDSVIEAVVLGSYGRTARISPARRRLEEIASTARSRSSSARNDVERSCAGEAGDDRGLEGLLGSMQENF